MTGMKCCGAMPGSCFCVVDRVGEYNHPLQKESYGEHTIESLKAYADGMDKAYREKSAELEELRVWVKKLFVLMESAPGDLFGRHVREEGLFNDAFAQEVDD